MGDREVERRAVSAIRPMRRQDLEQIMEIERGAHRSPWSREVFLEELHRGWAYVDVLCDAEAAPGSREPPLRAFVNYWLVGDEVHVLNVATHPDARRRGLASHLLTHVVSFARDRRCRFVTLEVRRSNRAALRLYRRHGFCPVGVRPRYYEDGEDAIVMLLELEAG